MVVYRASKDCLSSASSTELSLMDSYTPSPVLELEGGQV